MNLHRSECISGTFPLAEYAQTLAPWRKMRRESSFGNHEHCFVEKTLRIQGKTPPFGIPINARWQVITPDASPLLIKQLFGALQTHSYTLPSFHFLSSSSRKNP
jgi:hypothetical protein